VGETTVNAPLKVVVLMGGRSAEREVSLNTGEQVSTALASLGHEVERLDTGKPGFVSRLEMCAADAVFICLHGRGGEDGTMQGLLELLELPYVGSGVLASALAMDKVRSKRFFESCGLPTPAWVALERDVPYELGEVVAVVGDRCVVKPANEGSSVGLTIVHQPAELPDALAEAFRYDASVVVERFVPGVEVTVGVLGNEAAFALPTLEIVPEHEFYDYESKYVPGMSTHIIPARVPAESRTECARISVEAHRALGCRGMSRSDVIVTEDGAVTLLEVNTIPGMTSTSLLPDAARAAGIEFPELCDHLVRWAIEDAARE
jgi:D-alanine-D-alanine ligase